MSHRMTVLLATGALVLAGLAGAVGANLPGQLTNDPEFNLAGFKTRSGGTEIAVVYHPAPTNSSNLVLAGFNTTKLGTEMSY